MNFKFGEKNAFAKLYLSKITDINHINGYIAHYIIVNIFVLDFLAPNFLMPNSFALDLLMPSCSIFSFLISGSFVLGFFVLDCSMLSFSIFGITAPGFPISFFLVFGYCAFSPFIFLLFGFFVGLP